VKLCETADGEGGKASSSPPHEKIKRKDKKIINNRILTTLLL
jgi:hypothetical protein